MQQFVNAKETANLGIVKMFKQMVPFQEAELFTLILMAMPTEFKRTMVKNAQHSDERDLWIALG